MPSELGPAFDDPSPFYNPGKKNQTPAASGTIPPVAARKLEAPIEERFKKQSAEWEGFKEQQKSAALRFKMKPTKKCCNSKTMFTS